jgi:hypothetical protein
LPLTAVVIVATDTPEGIDTLVRVSHKHTTNRYHAPQLYRTASNQPDPSHVCSPRPELRARGRPSWNELHSHRFGVYEKSRSVQRCRQLLSTVFVITRYTMPTYAVLGSTGNCGTALIQNLLKSPDNKINAYCRNVAKLHKLIPQVIDNKDVKVFSGSITDVELMEACVRDTQAVFMVATTNDNIPGCHISQVRMTSGIITSTSLIHSSRYAGQCCFSHHRPEEHQG